MEQVIGFMLKLRKNFITWYSNLLSNNLKIIRDILSFVVLFTVTAQFSMAQMHQKFEEKGQYYVRHYSPKEMKSVAESYHIIQDARGVMYFANGAGVVEYTGRDWHLHKMPDDLRSFRLGINHKGVVYFGGESLIGCLLPEDGKITFKVLNERINEQLSEEDKDNFGDIIGVENIGEKVFFFTKGFVFIEHDGEFKVIKHEHHITNVFKVGEKIFADQKDVGLVQFKNEAFLPMAGGGFYKTVNISDVIVEEGVNDALTIITERFGFYNYNLVSGESKLKGAGIYGYLAGKRVYTMEKIGEDKYVVGTEGKGMLVCNSNADLIEIVSGHEALIGSSVLDVYLDKENNLWAVSRNGVFKLKIKSSLTHFNNKKGLIGTIEDIERSNGVVYASTTNGVFKLNSDTILGNYFEQVQGIPSGCFGLLNFTYGDKEMLLVSETNGIYEVERGKKAKLLFEYWPWSFERSTYDSNRVYVALDDGLASIYYKDGKWVNEGRIEGMEGSYRNVAEADQNTLWVSSTGTGFFKVQFSLNPDIPPSVEDYTKGKGAPEGAGWIYKYKDEVLFGTGKGLYFYNESKDVIEPWQPAQEKLKNYDIGTHRISSDHQNNLWVVNYFNVGKNYQIGYANNHNGKYNFNFSEFIEISDEIIHGVHHDKDGVTWLGGPDGLFRYNSNDKSDTTFAFKSILHAVAVAGDTVFSGIRQNEEGYIVNDQGKVIEVPYESNSLMFSFSSNSFDYEEEIEFKYILEGYDSDWSQWTKQSKEEYSKLPEGRYTFKVMARNIYGDESEVAEYTIVILHPWYRSVWAYVLYFFIFVGFVILVVRLSMLRLKKQNLLLEEKVNQRTEELRERNEDLARQKALVDEKNKDIMDSIHYAKRLQDAILPPDDQMKKALPESFVLYKPKDIVSGDFYWMREKKGIVYFAAVDCTGHGVPGAIVSIVGHNGLTRIMNEFELIRPARILDQLNDLVEETFRQLKDGMDMALCALDAENMELQYAGANNPLWIVREGEIFEQKADKQPIGAYADRKPFTNHLFQLKKGDTIYVFSDGYADQFGGPREKKYKYKKLKNFLLEIQDKPMIEQKELLNKEFEDWKGSIEQLDDVCVFAVRV